VKEIHHPGFDRQFHYRLDQRRRLSGYRSADGRRVCLHSTAVRDHYALRRHLVSIGRFNLPLAATAGAIGCNLGSALAYEIGARGGRRMVERWGTWVLLDYRELDRMDHYFKRFGGITVLICRLLPVVRTFVALPAGIARMPRLRFHVYTFAGSWPWCFALAFAGLKLGQQWDTDPQLRAIMHRLDGLVIAALLIGIGWFVWHPWRHRITNPK
jgi:membrane protein DedA with SNARE-associated domain